MEDKKKLVCPVCGAMLTIKLTPDIENKAVRCPVCRKVSRYIEFRAPSDTPDTPDTVMPGFAPAKDEIGCLEVIETGQTIQLKEGRNLIGRQSPNSIADIQLPSPNNRLSREHLVIEVNRLPRLQGYVYYAYLNKERLNRTFVDTVMIYYGDRVVLNHGTVLHLPDCDVRLLIP